MRRPFPTALWLALLGGPVFAADTPVVSLPSAPYVAAPGLRPEAASAADLVNASALLGPRQVRALGPLSDAERIRLAAPDPPSDSGIQTLRAKTGVVRELAPAAGFADGLPPLARGERRTLGDGLLLKASDGRTAWTASVSSAGSSALRLYLTGSGLPEGSRAYVYTRKGEIRGPYTLTAGRGVWTNRVEGDQAFVELQLSAGGAAARARFAIERVNHLAAPSPAASAERVEATTYINPCFLDLACVSASEFPAIDQVSHAVAELHFMAEGFSAVCTGTLLNANPTPALPYLLTAHHCISTQTEADSIEAIYNNRAATCGGAAPDISQLPRTLGATLLATSAASDFSLFHLVQAPPAGAVLLGWTTQAVATVDSATIYRVSHPADGNTIAPQIYVRESVLSPPGVSCFAIPYPDFIYASVNKGGEGPGSSGSSVTLSDGRVVGQLYGTCGNGSAPCDPVQHASGAFRSTYPHVAAFLNPGASDACFSSDTTLCLNNNRYRVTAAWSSTTASGQGHAQPLTTDTGYFWFFGPSNVEMIVKVLDACSFYSKTWVFAGGLTNVQVTVTVTDTISGAVKTYVNPQSTAFRPVQDTTAFATCP